MTFTRIKRIKKKGGGFYEYPVRQKSEWDPARKKVRSIYLGRADDAIHHAFDIANAAIEDDFKKNGARREQEAREARAREFDQNRFLQETAGQKEEGAPSESAPSENGSTDREF